MTDFNDYNTYAMLFPYLNVSTFFRYLMILFLIVVLLQLMKQMAYLDDWAVLERGHIDALSGTVEDLEASTLRLPLTGGAKVCMVFVSWFDACIETLLH